MIIQVPAISILGCTLKTRDPKRKRDSGFLETHDSFGTPHSNETTFVYLKRFQPTSQVGRKTSSNKKMQRIPTIFVSPFEHYQPKQCINYGQVTLESTMHRYCIVWFSNTWICILGCLEKVKHIPPNGGWMVISLMLFIPILPIPFNVCNNSVGDSCWKGGGVDPMYYLIAPNLSLIWATKRTL